MIYEIKTCYAVKKFNKHELLKDLALNSIANDPTYGPYENITKTDWLVDSKYNRVYMSYLSDILLELKVAYLEMGYSNFNVVNYWFQQYENNSFHDWHIHNDCNFSNVYYLELPNSCVATEIKDSSNVVFTPNVKEGDILMLPAHIAHRSPVNKTGNRKTVIVFNTNVYI